MVYNLQHTYNSHRKIQEYSRVPPNRQRIFGLSLEQDPRGNPTLDDVVLGTLKRTKRRLNRISCTIMGQPQEDIGHNADAFERTEATAPSPSHAAALSNEGIGQEFVDQLQDPMTEITMVESGYEHLQRQVLPRDKMLFELRKLENHLMNQLLKVDSVSISNDREREYRREIIVKVQRMQSELDKSIDEVQRRDVD